MGPRDAIGRYQNMAMPGKVTYLRRFAGKFVEIVAAGIGTAVSGYLVAFMAAHFAFFAPVIAFFTPATVAPIPPQATGWPAKPRDNASVETTVRAALANHDTSRGTPVVALPLPAAPASAETQASPETQTSSETVSATAVGPPLATAEIRSLPVAAAASALPAESDAWPSDPSATSSAGRFGMLPPQPPPANVNVLMALKRLF
jgi:hypothetical protein